MATSLRRLGFDVIENISRKEMTNSIRELIAKGVKIETWYLILVIRQAL